MEQDLSRRVAGCLAVEQERVGLRESLFLKQQAERLVSYRQLQPCQAGRDLGRCEICFEKMFGKQLTIRLPCLHLFHKRCLDRSFRRARKCPLDGLPLL